MKKEKWKRAASVLAAAPTLTGAFGGAALFRQKRKERKCEKEFPESLCPYIGRSYGDKRAVFR